MKTSYWKQESKEHTSGYDNFDVINQFFAGQDWVGVQPLPNSPRTEKINGLVAKIKKS